MGDAREQVDPTLDPGERTLYARTIGRDSIAVSCLHDRNPVVSGLLESRDQVFDIGVLKDVRFQAAGRFVDVAG